MKQIHWYHPKKRLPATHCRVIVLIDNYGAAMYGHYDLSKKQWSIYGKQSLDIYPDTVKAWAHLNLPEWADAVLEL